MVGTTCFISAAVTQIPHNAGMNAGTGKVCNSRSSLFDVFHHPADLTNSQQDRTDLRNAQLELPSVWLPSSTQTHFKAVNNASNVALAAFPLRFHEQEQGAVLSFCTVESSTVDGPDRTGTERFRACRRQVGRRRPRRASSGKSARGEHFHLSRVAVH